MINSTKNYKDSTNGTVLNEQKKEKLEWTMRIFEIFIC